MYSPACASACHAVIAAPLNCTDADMGPMKTGRRRRNQKRMHMGGQGSSSGDIQGDGWMVMADASAECRCNNDFYLQTLAYCLSTRCAEPSVPTWVLEKYWVSDVAGPFDDQPVPKQSYQESLRNITERPTRPLNNSILLNYTAVVTDDQWVPEYLAEVSFERGEVTQHRFGLVLFLSGTVVPIGLTVVARLIPWPAGLVSRFHAYLVDPPALGHAHSAPAGWGFVVPTRGQALFVAYLWALNVVLGAVRHDVVWPNAWWPTAGWEAVAYVGNRVGVLSFANLPLVALYAGRNNVLLWLTNWSHSTFLLLHRWIAFICMLEAVLHSVLYLYAYTQQPGYDHGAESRLPYWYCGVIATLAMAILMPISHQRLRSKVYSAVFLPSHIVFSILALLGCYLHIIFRFNRQWGYETWIYMAVAMWTFDRLARLARIARSMVSGRHLITRRAFVVPIDDHYFRLDIVPGITGVVDGHVYLHFPSLSTWRFWESHPFSVAGASHGTGDHRAYGPIRVAEQSQHRFKDKEARHMDVRPQAEEVAASDNDSAESPRLHDPGVPPHAHAAAPAAEGKTTLFVKRTATGLTSLLATNTESTGLPVLVEPSYGTLVTLLQAGQPGSHMQLAPSGEFPNLLCIAGGVGITAVLPTLQRASGPGPGPGVRTGARKPRLYWGLRAAPLLRAVEDLLGYLPPRERAAAADDDGRSRRVLRRAWGDVQVTVSVGGRFDLRALLASELAPRHHGAGVGTTVVVCSPPGMSDAIRTIVAGLSRHGALVRLIVEDFAW